MPSANRSLLFGAFFCLLGSCASYTSEQGVENSWGNRPEAAFQSGVTTQTEVADLLGPPSQIVSLANGSAFYYLRERSDGQAYILIIYNDVRQNVRYDRAVFFFDSNGLLTHHAIRDDIPAS